MVFENLDWILAAWQPQSCKACLSVSDEVELAWKVNYATCLMAHLVSSDGFLCGHQLCSESIPSICASTSAFPFSHFWGMAKAPAGTLDHELIVSFVLQETNFVGWLHPLVLVFKMTCVVRWWLWSKLIWSGLSYAGMTKLRSALDQRRNWVFPFC